MSKLKRLCCATFAAIILLSHLCVFAGVDNGPAKISLDNVTALPGQQVDINVTLTENPGITGLRFFVAYDKEALKLERAVYTKIGGGGLAAVKLDINPFVLLWNVSMYEFTETGVMATLTFSINEGASVGDYPLRLTWGKGDCIDFDLKNLDVKISGGNVHVDYNGSNCSHKSTRKETTLPSTCTSAGKYDVICNACYTKVGEGDHAVTEHSYGPLIVTKLPSFTEIGLKEQTCSVCGDVRTEPIDMLERPPEYTEGTTTQYIPATQGGTTTQAPTPNTQGGVTTQAPTPNTQGSVTTQAPTPNTQGSVTTQAPTPNTQGSVTTQAPTQDTQGSVTTQPSTPDTQGGVTTQPSTPGAQGGVTTQPSTPGTQSGVTTQPSTPDTQGGETTLPPTESTSTSVIPEGTTCPATGDDTVIILVVRVAAVTAGAVALILTKKK